MISIIAAYLFTPGFKEEVVVMRALLWVLSALLPFLGGIFFLKYLVAKPTQMSLYLALALGMAALWLVVALKIFSGWQWLGGLALALVCLGLGYLTATMVYLNQEEHRQLPEIARSAADPGDGHTAVLYFTHGEPPAYSAMPWIETFHELDKDGVSFVPKPFRPFFLYNLRREYLENGGSAHNKIHQIMLNELIKSLPAAQSLRTRFYLAFLDNSPRPDEMAIQAVNEGASKLIVMPVFLTQSSHTHAGEEMIQALELEKLGISVCYATPLWDNEDLRQMFVNRANQNLQSAAKSKVGILLVGHGQPDDWDHIYPTQTEQETLFRNAVREMLILDGYKPENVVLAWMEFKRPVIAEGVRSLLNNGVERILVFSASISADSIHSDIQTPEAVYEVNIPESVKVVNLGAWGNDPQVIAAIRQKIVACEPALAGLSRQQA
jgi:protoheme ferro-lyase